MTLPNSYTLKPGAIPDYFEAMLNAQPPERFSQKFMEGLGFSSSNDRLFIAVLKELGFLTSDGAPTERYFDFLDRSLSQMIVADGIRTAFGDLFAVNTQAQNLNADEVFNKLRTLYKGEKKDTTIKYIARTFTALCEYADFESIRTDIKPPSPLEEELHDGKKPEKTKEVSRDARSVDLSSLQYHINIVLPESRDQAVYDAIFKSLRDHLG